MSLFLMLVASRWLFPRFAGVIELASFGTLAGLPFLLVSYSEIRMLSRILRKGRRLRDRSVVIGLNLQLAIGIPGFFLGYGNVTRSRHGWAWAILMVYGLLYWIPGIVAGACLSGRLVLASGGRSGVRLR